MTRPLVPVYVDLRDMPVPREAFAQMAVLQFGITIEEARAQVARSADAIERNNQEKRRRSK